MEYIKSWFIKSAPPDELIKDPVDPDDPRVTYDLDSIDCRYSHQPPHDGQYKRLIIACDGTWQDSNRVEDGVTSNVTRLSRMLETSAKDKNGNIVQQIVFYQAGVGTGTFQRNTGGLFGWGLEENIRQAYIFLANNYEQGDEIFIFGFSRGAYTARSVAGLVNDLGILMKENLEYFPAIYKVYKESTDHVEQMKKLNAHLALHHTDGTSRSLAFHINVPIKVVGVWDTVGSLGVPDWPILRLFNSASKQRYKFHNTELSYGIEYAFQALALDESRASYSPTLWYLPKKPEQPIPNPKYPEERIDKEWNCDPEFLRAKAQWEVLKENGPPRLQQVWFPGVHIDIGGGTTEKAFPEFSDLSLFWMIDQVKDFLAFNKESIHKVIEASNQRAINLWVDEVKANKTWGEEAVNHTGKKLKDLVATDLNFFPPEHPAAVARERKFQWASRNRFESWKLSNPTAWSGRKFRTPGFYGEKFTENSIIRGPTNEAMHPVVRLRFKQGVPEPEPQPTGSWIWSWLTGPPAPPTDKKLLPEALKHFQSVDVKDEVWYFKKDGQETAMGEYQLEKGKKYLEQRLYGHTEYEFMYPRLVEDS